MHYLHCDSFEKTEKRLEGNKKLIRSCSKGKVSKQRDMTDDKNNKLYNGNNIDYQSNR